MFRRLLFTTLLSFLLIACSDTPGPTQWRFALEEIQGSVQDAYAQRFKARVEALSQGRIQVIIYPYGTLGTSAQITEQVRSGAIQFAFASPGHLGAVIPETQLFSLHFLFSDDDEVNRRMLKSSPTLYGPLAEAYREKGLALMSVVPEGWMVWTGNRPLRTPEDFRGFKMRTMVSPLLVEAYKAYGASPTPMPYSEVYSGLQLNLIDGQVNPVFAIEEMSFHEVQTTMIFPRHLPFVATVIANPAFVAGLAPEERAMLAELKEELDDYIFEVQERYNRERLEKIRGAADVEMVTLAPAQRAVFRRASEPVRERYVELAGERGGRILEAFIAERTALEHAGKSD